MGFSHENLDMLQEGAINVLMAGHLFITYNGTQSSQ